MNKLSMDKQIIVVKSLIEGSSIRSIERITGIHRDTVMRLGVRIGESCTRIMDETMRGLSCKHVEIDELWTYFQKKQRHIAPQDDRARVGDIWTYVALDRETKVVPCFRVSKRTSADTHAFMLDLAGRLESRCQLSTDGLNHYVDACARAFGSIHIDYGQVVKSYEAEPIGPGRYSPPKVVSTSKSVIFGNPDPRMISTSHVERLNLSVRMSLRRYTRLTNGFSKKLENLRAASGLFFAYYNLARVHSTLRVTPAMEAGLSSHIWTMGDLIERAGTAN